MTCANGATVNQPVPGKEIINGVMQSSEHSADAESEQGKLTFDKQRVHEDKINILFF